MEANNLVIEGHQEYPDALTYVFGQDHPPLTPVLMKEYLRYVDENGGWPDGKGLANEKFLENFLSTPEGWIPVIE